MAEEILDNFQNYGTDTTRLTDGVYAEVSGVMALVADPDGVSSGYVLRIGNTNNGGNGWIRKVLSGSLTTVGVARKVYMPALPQSDDARPALIDFRDSSNVTQIAILCETTGALSVYRGATQLGITPTPVLTANAWGHIEVKVLIHNSAGTVTIRVNGEEELALTGQDTTNTANVNCAQINFAANQGSNIAGSDTHNYMKDLYIWNSSGSLHNTFQGVNTIYTLRPSSDVSFNWNASTGSVGYSLIDDVTPDDTDYISADDSPPSPSIFGLTNLPVDVTSIHGVMIFTRMKKTDGGDGTVQMSLISGGDTGSGDDRPITTTFTTYMDAIETDPDTGIEWTPAAINAMTLKTDRTT